MSFLKNLFTNLLSLVLFAFITVVLFILVVVSSGEEIDVKENSVLKVSIKQNLVDRANSSEFNFFNADRCGNGLFEIQKAIQHAKNDDRIKAIYLEIGELNGSLANVLSLKNTIEEYRSTGRKVIVFSEGMSQIGYYLACSSDSIYLNHLSFVEWKGLGAKLMYFKSMLNKLGVKAEPIRVGKFKSAIEPFISDTMSTENHFQVKEMLDDIWFQIKHDVSKQRNITTQVLNDIADNYGYLMPLEALKFRLIDGIKYEDEVLSILQKVVGYKTNYINVSQYNSTYEDSFSGNKAKIVVVNAEGAIVDGISEKDISLVKYAKIFDDVLKDDSIKGMVLRINSPGGSALASEILWRKIKRIQRKMPVMVSMGNVAASGGYYLASAGDTILAEKNTITGSIGVFGLMFNAGDLAKSFGVRVENVKTNDLSDFPAFDRSLSKKEYQRMKYGIQSIYETFIQRVQDSRGMSKKNVEELAQGRVWTGNQAKINGLIDEIGGLNNAVELAVQRAGVKKYQVVHLPKELSGVEKIVHRFSKKTEISLPAPFTKYNYILQNPRLIQDFSRPQLRLPFLLELN